MRIGIDLGGTKIEAIALDDDGGEFMRIRAPTPAGNYSGALDAIADLVARIETRAGRRCTVGVAAPGAISPRTGLVKNSNSTVLNGKPLDRDLSDRLARAIRIENDANCFALSEAADGAAAGAGAVFGVILGTGVGGAVVFDRRLVPGRNRIAGEWGHNPLPWATVGESPGASCYCGKSGCIETYLSGSGLSREHRARSGAERTALEIAGAASAGDPDAKASLDAYRDRLARSLASVVNVLDPDVIVLGGGLSNIPWLYEGLPALIGRHAFSDGVDTPVLRAVHGDSSGVRGAARLWPARTPV